VAAPGPAAQAVPQPAAALMHPIPDGGLTMEEVVGWLQSAGYSAKVVADENSKRHIVSATQGSPLNIYLRDCAGDRCASLDLDVGFATHGKFDVAHLNEWNSNNRWCRAYCDNVNDPWLEMNIDLSPGGTYESLNDQFATWNATLARFINQYGLRI
jgi:hypothetical protein